MALSIMNYTRTATYPAGELVKSYYPEVNQCANDPDTGSTAIVLDAVTPDTQDAHGTVRILTLSGVRVVDSVSVGVWIEKTD